MVKKIVKKESKLTSTDIAPSKSVYDKIYWQQLILAIILLLIGSYAIASSLHYVNTLPLGPPLHDLFFDIFPFNNAYAAAADIVMIVADILFISYVILKKQYKDLPFFIVCMAAFQFLRAIILPLTPLPGPNPDPSHFGILYGILIGGGTFPSGHAGQVFLLFFITKAEHYFSKYSLLVLGVLEGLFMVISRGHYTIDIVASIFITYSIYKVADNYRTKIAAKKLLKQKNLQNI